MDLQNLNEYAAMLSAGIPMGADVLAMDYSDAHYSFHIVLHISQHPCQCLSTIQMIWQLPLI